MPFKKLKGKLGFEDLLIACSSVGLLSAVILTIEKFHLLENPEAALSCDLNPIVACGPIINTPQASAFGFPNPIIGIVGFSVVLTIAVAIKAGAKFKPWFWRGLQIGVIFGVGFIHWLMYQSIFTIKALCPYCMVVWAIMIPLFVYTTRYNTLNGHIKSPFKKRFYGLRAFETVILWYLIIAGIILVKFWYYWEAVLPFAG